MSDTYPLFPTRTTQRLDGIWDFCWLGGEAKIDDVAPAKLAYDDVQAVPGVFDTDLQRRNVRGVGVYRRAVECAAGMQRLTIGGMGLYGRIFWDGHTIGEYRTPYAEVSCDVKATAGRHEIQILVDNRFLSHGPELFHAYDDFYAFGGIYRTVTLQHLPAVSVERAVVTTLDLATGRVRLTLKLGGQESGEVRVGIGFDGAAPQEVTLPVHNSQAVVERNVPGFRLWSPEHPNLHTVAVTLAGDTVVERFGIRTVATRGQQILINGKPVRLLGVNRHESHPEFGPVQPDQLAIDDLRVLRELGCNFIRCVHYQHNPAFFDLCDRMGFLVWEESLGWGCLEADATNPATAALAVQATELMVNRNINNPSIIIWAFLNEGCDNTAAGKRWYGEIAAAIRAIDRSRLVTFASMHKEHGLCYGHADVISINSYPGWFSGVDASHQHYLGTIRPEIERLAEVFDRPEYGGKPLIMSEIGTCGLWGYHDYGRAQWSEEFQSDYFAEACRAVLGNPRYAGLALWEMFDSKSYVNAGAIRGKPRGFNCAGLVDEYRRPKLAFQTVRAIYREQP
jgi:beta-glucuronidase